MSMRYPGGLIATTPVNQQYPSGVWTGPQASPYQANNVWGSDPFFRNTTLLLQGSGSVAPFIKDSSANNFNLAISGDTRSSSYTPFQGDGYYSNYFDGSGDYLTCSSSATNFSTASFTIEFWVNFTSLPSSGSNYNIISATVTNGVEVLYRGTGSYIEIGRYGVGPSLQYSWTPSLNAWNHVAFVRNGTTVNIYINGTSVASGTVSQDFQTGTTNIGSAGGSQSYFAGYLSNLRVVKNTAVYTSNFTPSTTPLTAITNTSLLTCADSRFVDDSTNAFAITANGNVAVNPLQPFTLPAITAAYGSGYFDGSGDYLGCGSQSAYAFGTGAFTAEAWVYVTSRSANYNIMSTRGSAGTVNGWSFEITTSGGVGVYSNSFIFNNVGTVPLNAWTHIAFVREGTGSNQTKIYINGTSVASATNSENFSNTTLAIGNANDGSQFPFLGYITNSRLVKGTAVYTSNFTSPTTPLAGIANTSLLTLQSNVPVNNNVFIDSSPNNYAITRTGSITQGSFTPYDAGYYSNYFDGSGDYLTLPNPTTLAFGTSDFTVEGWFNFSAFSGASPYFTHALINCYENQSGSFGFSLGVSTSNNLINVGIGDTNLLNTPFTAVVGAWYHIAVSRSGGTIRLFVNGTLATSASNSSNFTTSTTPTVIGSLFVYGTGYTMFFNGYASNVRVIKGTGIYTASFTPSTTPLTAVANTALLTCQSNRFIDNSTNAYAITRNGDTNVQGFQPFPPALQYTPASFSGSGYFFGASNNLQTPSGSCPVINNFSASGWVYRTSVPGYQQTFFAMGLDGFGRIGFFWTGNNLEYNIYGSSTVTVDGSGSMPVGSWTYVVVTRTGSTLTLYYNGVLRATVTLSGSFSASSGRSMSWMDGTIGYATNLRFDTAAYSSPTTVPTAPLSPTANTNNLLNFTNAGIVDSASQNALVTVGDSKVNTSVVKYGTGSMYFDGSGDYLTAYRSFSIAANENFTVEGWFYLTAAQANYRMIVSDGTKYFTVNSGGMEIQFGAVSGTIANATYAFSQNVWYHIAVVRNNNVVAIYVNGIALTMSQASQSAAFLDTGTLLYVSRYTSGTDYPWFGYIDDLRITKGVARYVTNFTPPVARMPNQ